MLSIFRKFSSLILLLIIFFGFAVPQTLAQGSFFEEPLETIKEKLEEGENGITVIEYSEEKWGTLPPEIIEILESEGYTSLNDIIEDEDIGYDQEVGNVEVLVEYLDDLGLSEDDRNLVINEIRFRGESQIQSIILAIAKVFRNLLGSFAVIWIIISGVQMVIAGGDESKVTEQKRSITYAVIGLAVVLLLERMIVLIYGVPGIEQRGFTERPEALSQEFLGLVSFIKAVIGAAAVLMIIISGFRTIAAAGDEEKLTKQKKSIIWIIVGIVIILVNQFIIENLYIEPVKKQIAETGEVITQTNVESVIQFIGTIIQFFLGFVGLIAFAALIYGAGTMIANYGNDELVQKAKKIIKNAIIGIIIIISAFAIVSTVIL